MDFNCPNCKSSITVEDNLGGAIISCPFCHDSVAVPRHTLEQGMKIGGFVLDYRLGVGGMGEVWLAEQETMQRKVALKILPQETTSNQEFVSRFMKEAHNSAKLDHQNIITAFDAGCDKGIYYLAISYVEGVELSDRLRWEKIIAEKEALKIIRGIAEALKYAWNEFRMLHRDIKPANIMIDKFGTPKLMDLGISKVTTEETGLTMTGIVLGTPHYMSPEQSFGDKELDCRADIYSLGATLYFAVTGEVPFDSSTAMGILSKHITEPLVPPTEKNPEVSEQCSALIEIMMAKDRDDRQRNWEDVIADIDNVLTGNFPDTNRPDMSKTVFTSQLTAAQTALATKQATAVQDPGTVAQPTAEKKLKLTKSSPAHTKHKPKPQKTIYPEPEKPKQKKTNKILIFSTIGASLLAAVVLVTVLASSLDGPHIKKDILSEKKPSPEKDIQERQSPPPARQEPKPSENDKQKELWDFAIQYRDKAIAENGNLRIAAKNFENIKRMLSGTKYELMADMEIEKLKELFDKQDNGPNDRQDDRRDDRQYDNRQDKRQDDRQYDNRRDDRQYDNRQDNRETNPSGEDPIEELNKALRKANPLYNGRGRFSTRNGRIDEVDLSGCPNIKDLSPLTGLNLRRLDLNRTKVTDLSPLKGMMLEDINLDTTRVSDLTPLKGMPLIGINLHATKIKDISALKGMPLEHLNIDETKVKDIKALDGMPLRELRMHGCPIRDFSPLKNCKQLERIEPGYIRYKLKNMR